MNLSTEKLDELLPCPFCGEGTHIGVGYRGSPPKVRHVLCDTSDCMGNSNENVYATEEKAIAAWNRRSSSLSSPQGAGVRELTRPSTEAFGELLKELRDASRSPHVAVPLADLFGEAFDALTDLNKLVDDLAAARAVLPSPKGAGATHRHKKRGSEYMLIGFGKMQAENWHSFEEGGSPVDMREVAIYRSVDDGSLWVRPREEFEDGRFEALVPTAVPPELTEEAGPWDEPTLRAILATRILEHSQISSDETDAISAKVVSDLSKWRSWLKEVAIVTHPAPTEPVGVKTGIDAAASEIFENLVSPNLAAMISRTELHARFIAAIRALDLSPPAATEENGQ